VVQNNDVTPICPWCEKKLRQIFRIADAKLLMNKGYCYVCPHCNKVLGFADYSA
jgi:uncharacterized protein with PIN domain